MRVATAEAVQSGERAADQSDEKNEILGGTNAFIRSLLPLLQTAAQLADRQIDVLAV